MFNNKENVDLKMLRTHAKNEEERDSEFKKGFKGEGLYENSITRNENIRTRQIERRTETLTEFKL